MSPAYGFAANPASAKATAAASASGMLFSAFRTLASTTTLQISLDIGQRVKLSFCEPFLGRAKRSYFRLSGYELRDRARFQRLVLLARDNDQIIAARNPSWNRYHVHGRSIPYIERANGFRDACFQLHDSFTKKTYILVCGEGF